VSGRRVKALPEAKRRDATAGSDLDAAAASCTIGGRAGRAQRCTGLRCRAGVIDLRAAVRRRRAPVPGGRPQCRARWRARASGGALDDLRYTAASVWLAAGADPKVVQRVLGHATAAMTMDLYGHMIDANLWQAARLVGTSRGTFEPFDLEVEDEDDQAPG
jgi:hypothetical protein